MNTSLLAPGVDAAALDAAIAEYLEMTDRGQEIDLPTFLAKHGRLAPQLRDFIDMADLVEEIVATPPLVGNKSAALKETSGIFNQATLISDAAPAQADVPTPTPGAKIGRYNILGALGEGSMGKVLLAYDTTLQRKVALKMPRFEVGVDNIERFYHEARASAELHHPHICPVFDVGSIDGVHFLSMAYIEGQNLAKVMESKLPLPITRLLPIIRKLASALEVAHQHNVIHRDLKPANIMLDAAGEPIVTDFGLARRLGARETLLTQSGMLIGTLSFMSPEQMEGITSRIGRATDIYSLGVICYQLLTGMLPFKGSFVSVVVQVRHGKPVPPSLIRPEINQHPGLEALCLKMLAKRPEQRYRSMTEVIAAIDALAGPSPIKPPPLPPRPEALPTITLAKQQEVIATKSLGAPRGKLKFASHRQQALLAGTSAAGLLSILAVLWMGSGLFQRPDHSLALQSGATAANASAPLVLTTHGPGGPQQVAPPVKPLPLVDKDSDQRELPIIQPLPPPLPVVVLAPKIEPAVSITRSAGSRIKDHKFGVGQIVIEFKPGEGPEFRPDLPCHVVASRGSLHYPAYALELEQSPAIDEQGDIDSIAHDNKHADKAVIDSNSVQGRLSKLTAHFLCLDKEPLQIAVYYAGEPLVQQQDIPVNLEPDRTALLNAWWTAYTAPSREAWNAEARTVKTYLQGMLARRLELPAAAEIPLPGDDASLLERYFEKSVGTFLGFTSVQSALGSKQDLRYGTHQVANHPLPTPPRIAAVPVPTIAEDVAIESIASHVPDDFVYLRCQSMDNYLWFRQFLLGWGGSLDEVVSSRASDDRTRERLEQQLALSLDDEMHLVLKRTCTDLAVMFSDPFFDQGTGVGVVFQTKNSGELARLLARQRSRSKARFEPFGANESNYELAPDRSVSLLATGDKRLLSYLCTHGDYTLVTNSRYMVTRFFEAGNRVRSLASLPEFRYARSKVRVHDEQSVFLYMSDPFFQRIISPQYQIERARRSQSRHELEQLSLAFLAAQSEDSPRRTAADLVQNRYLPAGFGTRSDETMPVLKSYAGGKVTQAEDSKRGLPGYFVPICDIPVQLATRSEIDAYHHFVNNYRSEYRMMDPVALVASHRSSGEGLQTVDLEITITPYAFGKYAALRNHLTTPAGQRIANHADDILQFHAAMQTAAGDSFLTYAGVRDRDVKFQIVDGRVVMEGEPVDSTFAQSNYYLAFDRRDSECLWSVAGITNGLSLTSINIDRARGASSTLSDAIIGIARLPIIIVNPRATFAPAKRTVGPGWHIMSGRNELKDQELSHVASSETKQARLELKGLQGRLIEPYIQAYTFLEARRASARNAALLDLVSQQLQLHNDDAIDALEDVFTNRLVCPLGGQYVQASQAAAPTWRSDKWPQASLYDEQSVPRDYHFAFLDWLRGLNVGFALEAQTLKADLQLQVKPPADPSQSQVVGAKK